MAAVRVAGSFLLPQEGADDKGQFFQPTQPVGFRKNAPMIVPNLP